MRITVNERFLFLKRVKYSLENLMESMESLMRKKCVYTYISKILYMRTSTQSGITGTRFILMTKTREK